MRKLLLLISLCFTLGVVAQQVTEQQALLKAQNFLKGKTFSKTSKARNIKGKSMETPFKHFYIFNVENDEGFVIVSGDERAKEILGYSDKGHLNYAEMPCNLKSWLNYYEEAIKAIPAGMQTTSAATRATKAAVSPILKKNGQEITWYQGDPFNDYCPASPEDPNAKSVTGCVATAMAQVMYYYEWPNTLPALDSYSYNDGAVTVPALEGRPMSWTSEEDLRWLSRYCGQAVQMAYGKNSSSAMEALVPVAMVNHFGYDGAERACNREAYDSETWNDMIYNELSQGRPVIYAGHDLQKSPGDDYGHCFIIDGYKENDTYHVNWGWGSSQANGYYAIDVMDAPDECTYSSKQLAVIGIQRPNGGTANYPLFSCTKMEVTSDMEISRASASDKFPSVTVSWKTPAQVLEPGKYDLCIYISQGNDGAKLVTYSSTDVAPGYMYNDDFTFTNFPGTLPNGTYKLSMRYKAATETEWHLTEGSDYRYIEFTQTGNTIKFVNYPIPSETPDTPDTPDTPPTGDQMWWGYYSESDAANLDLDYDGIGYSQGVTIDAGISVPANHEFVGGSTIKALRIWLSNDVTKISGNAKIWISKTLPTNISAADYVQEVPLSSLAAGKNEIELTTPYVVNNSAFSIGITIKISGRAYPLLCNGLDVENGFFYRINSGDWDNLYGQGYGNLAMQLLIAGGTYPTNAVTANNFGQAVVQKGKSINIPVTFYNRGKDPVNTISYTIATEGGSTAAEKSLDLGGLSFNGAKTFNIAFASDNDAKKYAKTITVTKVNGVANTASKATATGSLITITEKPTVVPVVEEFTGTWCGYCPYGTVGMQNAHAKYGDKVILIAAHYGDPMESDKYMPVLYAYADNFPSSRIDRGASSVYPYNLTYYLDAALDKATQGSISLTAAWSDEGKTGIDFSTDTKFVYNDTDGKYGIAFALVEDGMSGSGSNWAQTNYLSGGTPGGDEDMAFWYSAASSVTGLEYDHVAVDAWDILKGVDGSVDTSIESGVVQKFSYKADISSNTLIQNKEKLTAVALLIDRANGQIVNAAKASIGDVPSGINGITTSEEGESARYSLDGRKMTTPKRGLNIIRMNDGTIKKVIVK